MRRRAADRAIHPRIVDDDPASDVWSYDDGERGQYLELTREPIVRGNVIVVVSATSPWRRVVLRPLRPSDAQWLVLEPPARDPDALAAAVRVALEW